MKNLNLISLSLFLVLGSIGLQAQYYTFSHLNEAYESIQNPDFSITDSTAIDTSSAMVTVFYTNPNIMAFGETLTGLMQAGPDGSLVALGTEYDFIFDPFFTDLRARGDSEFRATEAIQGNDTIFEMEWYHLGLEGAPPTDFVTIKARFYITQELIEFHFGESQVQPDHEYPFGPFCGLFHATQGFGSYIEVMALTGDPAEPDVNFTTGTLSTIPPEGTLYRFSGPQVTSLSDSEIEYLRVKIYPNPSNGTFSLESVKTLDEVRVFNNNGQEVYSQVGIGSNRLQLSLDLSPGNYTVMSTFTEGGLPSTKSMIIK